MCECGCVSVDWQWKIIGRDGHAWMFGVYASCRTCVAPAGIQVTKIPPKEFEHWDVAAVPALPMNEYGVGFIPVCDYQILREQVKASLIGFKPDDGKIDEIDADVLAEEAIPDLRKAVFETLRQSAENSR